jgi:hypothetical protein
MATLLVLGGLSATPALHAQTILKRNVMGGGGGTVTSTEHTVRGTLSQTAVGRLTHAGSDRHDVGFWYWAYHPDVITQVSIPTMQAEIGTRVRIPVEVTVGTTLIPFTPRNFHARISYNHTLLRTAGNTPPCTRDGNDCDIEFDGTLHSDSEVVAELEFVVALGDTEATPITIEEFTWEQGSGEERVATVRHNGELQLLGVCRVGGELRLITAGAFASRVRVWPNPASKEATMEFVSAEGGPATIRLVDVLGNEVARLYDAEIDPERLYQWKLDLSGIPSGSYTVVCRTTTKAVTQRLMITQ